MCKGKRICGKGANAVERIKAHAAMQQKALTLKGNE